MMSEPASCIPLHLLPHLRMRIEQLENNGRLLSFLLVLQNLLRLLMLANENVLHHCCDLSSLVSTHTTIIWNQMSCDFRTFLKHKRKMFPFSELQAATAPLEK